MPASRRVYAVAQSRPYARTAHNQPAPPTPNAAAAVVDEDDEVDEATINVNDPGDPDGEFIRQMTESADNSSTLFCNLGAMHQSLKDVTDYVRSPNEKHRIAKLPGNRGCNYEYIPGTKRRGKEPGRVASWIVPHPLWNVHQMNEYLHKVTHNITHLGNIVFRVGEVGGRKKVREVADGWNRITLLDRFVNNETSMSVGSARHRMWFGPNLPDYARSNDRVLPQDRRDWLLAQHFVVEQWQCSREEAARRAHDLNRARPTSKLEHVGWMIYCGTPNASVVQRLFTEHAWMSERIGGDDQFRRFIVDVTIHFSKVGPNQRFVVHNEAGLRDFMESDRPSTDGLFALVSGALMTMQPILQGLVATGRTMKFKRLVMAALVAWRENRLAPPDDRLLTLRVDAVAVHDAFENLHKKATYEELLSHIYGSLRERFEEGNGNETEEEVETGGPVGEV